jgi:hypothetical protein
VLEQAKEVNEDLFGQETSPIIEASIGNELST